LNGLNGTNASTIVPEQLCSAATAGRYPEQGLKIGNQLFAVYWGALNGSSVSQAFLAALAPGAYTSTNGTGCQFTVNADGTVSYPGQE
jgi:hypothetical protein